MPNFSAKDVQALRQESGAGMMDAKKALVENDGDMDSCHAVAEGKRHGSGGQAGRA